MFPAGEQPVHRFLHIGIQMHRINDLNISASCQFQQSPANLFHGLAEIFPAMRCDKDQPFAGEF